MAVVRMEGWVWEMFIVPVSSISDRIYPLLHLKLEGLK